MVSIIYIFIILFNLQKSTFFYNKSTRFLSAFVVKNTIMYCKIKKLVKNIILIIKQFILSTILESS